MNNAELIQLPIVESMYKNGVPLRDLVSFMSTNKMSAKNLDYFKNEMVRYTFIYEGGDMLGLEMVRKFPEFNWFYRGGSKDGERIPKKVIDANIDEIAEDEEYWINGVMATSLTKKQLDNIKEILKDENFIAAYKGYESYKIGVGNNLKRYRL